MYKVLIADDEPFVRKNIIERIKLSQLPLTIIGEAGDAACALRLYEEHQPALILVDINMPGMDGLEMITRMQQQAGKQTKYVVISGYDDFLHLQRAIRIGVDNYIRKPIVQSEFIQVLQTVCDTIEQEKSIARTPMDNTPVMIYSRNEFSDRVLAQGAYYLLFQNSGIPLQPADFLQTSIDPVKKEPEYYFLSFPHTPNLLLVIHPTKCVVNPHIVQQSAEKIARILKLQVVCNSFHDKTYGQLIRESENILSLRLLHEHRVCQVLMHQQTEIEDAFSPSSLITLLEKEQWEQAVIWIKALKPLYQKDRTSLLQLQRVYYTLMLALMNLYVKFELETPEYLRKAIEPFALTRFDTLQEIQDELCGNVQVYQAAYNQTYQKNDMIERAVQYLKLHFCEDVSMHELGNELFVSPAYLSVRFKEKTGVTLSQYLENIRMKKAKQYLQDTTLSVSQIAELVGYRDSSYFTRVFKKALQCSPRTYRMRQKESISNDN